MATKNKDLSQTMDTFDHDELLALARFDVEKGNLSEALWKLKQLTAAESAPAEAFSIAWEASAEEQGADKAKDRIKVTQLVSAAVPVRSMAVPKAVMPPMRISSRQSMKS